MPATFDNLYLHVPFCAVKCDYCAFYSIPAPRPEEVAAYSERIITDIAAATSLRTPLNSIYIGGGTPSQLPPHDLRRIFRALRERNLIGTSTEVTVEANPDSLTDTRIAEFATGGVNRVSLGVQSFCAAFRACIGRHTPLPSMPERVKRLHAAGIRNLGIDLIYAVPGQGLTEWREELSRACDLGVSHLSTYALTPEEGTRLGQRSVPVPDDDAVADLWEATEETVSAAGLQRYEISNVALPGWECRHNDAVWHGASYLGLGPAAASFDGRDRWTQPADLHRWLARTTAPLDRLPPPARAAEILAFGLRTARGWPIAEFATRTGFDPFALRGDALERLTTAGLLTSTATPTTLQPTRRGMLLHDDIAAELL